MGEQEIKKDEELSPELHHIAREKGTEASFSSEILKSHKRGMFTCAVCGTELFSSDTKFDSGSGWPSFTDPTNLENIELSEDNSGGMIRTEVSCKKCKAHLGHVFDDGPGESKKRYCINGVALCLEEEK